VSIVLAYSKRLHSGADKKDLYKKIVIRSLKIFGVGLFLNLFPLFDFNNLRVTGVLQRIAIVFFVCSFLYLNANWKTLAKIGAGILVIYWIVMAFIPVPGLGIVSLEPGQNIAAWIDSYLLPGRMWQVTWDPEGLFSTFPAIATGITGMLAGTLIVSKETLERKIIWLFTLGFFSLIVGGVWDWFFSINKNLWSSSFVLYTSGAAALTLATSMFVVDVLNIKKWTRVGRIFGANAITVYVIAGLIPRVLTLFKPGGYTLTGWFMNGFEHVGIDPRLASLCYALAFTLICYIPAYILYKKKIFIKL
jgi:predicted acyltransferase